MSEKLLFWGIDGCKTGWFCVGLGAAITAKMGFENNTSPYQTLPDEPPTDSCGLPMEMLYIEPSFP